MKKYFPVNVKNWAATKNLTVLPRAGNDANAYYDRRTLSFFYFNGNSNKRIYTCDSADVVTHELGHAIDPKLYPNSKHKVSDKYWSYLKELKASLNKSSRMHFVEPIEVDAEGLSMKNHIMEYFKALRTIKNKQEFIKELETSKQSLRYYQRPD